MAGKAINHAEVLLWGKTIGYISWDSQRQQSFFEYEQSFAKAPYQLSPFTMPTGSGIFTFPQLSDGFKGLPGLLADSLPDKFGQRLINEWMRNKSHSSDPFSPVEALCYIRSRGMGALEFKSSSTIKMYQDKDLEIQSLVDQANRILKEPADESQQKNNKRAIDDLLNVGVSAGGARAKAIVAWNQTTNEMRPGHIKRDDPTFTNWLIKFDGVSGNRDKEAADPQGFGKVEYTYYEMARLAGITMNECRLFEDGNLSHFITKRFDRTDTGQKLHMQTLCGMRHFDYNRPRHYSYEDALSTILQLKMPHSSLEEQYRRMVFNVIARNQDDHTKNISFLMNKKGEWSLSPAYDITYAYNPSGAWTSTHQMTLNGKSDNFTRDDLMAVAKTFFIKTRRRDDIIEEVSDAVAMWPKLAAKNNIDSKTISKVQQNIRSYLGCTTT